MKNCSRFEYNSRFRILFKYYEGDIELEDIVDSWTKAIAGNIIPDNIKGFVLDYRKAHFVFELNRLEEISNFYRDNINVFGNKRIAFITEYPYDIVYPVLIQTKDKGYTTRPFSTMGAAVAWVSDNELVDVNSNTLTAKAQN